ncbi:MAG: nucleotidyltransferase domain-containing protein [Candidatus Hydrogenedentes bacterium]|nr:nucleotidyltransferase domain-containing protein [Candidatus Hydrogenedentota bacterium]
MKTAELHARVRVALRHSFGDRLRQVVHYGSTARGDERSDSDVDYLVVIEGPVRLGDDLDKIVQSLYPIQLEIDRPIHAMPVDELDFEAGAYGLYRAAKRDGAAI